MNSLTNESFNLLERVCMRRIDIPNQEKVYVGKVIEFSRKQNNFTIDAIIDGICSKQTYYKLQKEPLSESEYYDQLLERVGLFYDYDSQNPISLDGLWNAFCEQEWSLFDQEIQGLKEQIMNPDVYQYVLSGAIQCIEQKQDIAYAKQLLPLLHDDLKEIVSYFVLWKIYESYVQYKEDVSYLSLKTEINQCQYLFLLIKNEQYYDASVLCEKLLQSTKGKNHDLARIAKLFLLLAIQPEDFVTQCEWIQKNEQLTADSFHAYELLYVTGIFYYKQENYKKAWSYFIQLKDIPQFHIPVLLFLYHMETITSYVLDKHPIPDTTEKDMKVLLTSYEMKYKGDSLQELEKYLWTECRKVIQCFYPPELAQKIIQDELFWIAQQTGNKSRYYQFNKIDYSINT